VAKIVRLKSYYSTVQLNRLAALRGGSLYTSAMTHSEHIVEDCSFNR
jgi:hypothetical protein